MTGARREPPNIRALLRVLNRHGVRYVVTGSVAAMLHGVELEPGDLDITPALDRPNLVRLAGMLGAIEARPDPGGPFGRWQTQPDGERRWAEYAPTAADIAARAAWRPDPDDPGSFDHLLRSKHGAIDIVPEVSGTFNVLVPGAVRIEAYRETVYVESIEDLLATLTVPRRARDADRVRRLRLIQRRQAGQSA